MSAVNKTLDYMEVRYKENRLNVINAQKNFDNKEPIIDTLNKQNELYVDILNQCNKEKGLPTINKDQLTNPNSDKMISESVKNLKGSITKAQFLEAIKKCKSNNQLNNLTIQGLENKLKEYEQKGVRFPGRSGKEMS